MQSVLHPVSRLPALVLSPALLTSCAGDPEDPEPHPTFTLVALPDTQIYADDYPEVFLEQTRWIVDHAELQEQLDYWTHTEEGRAEYYEAAFGDGQRDSEFVLPMDFAAYRDAD